MMILTVDNLATRYHKTPTEIVETGTSFDMYVIDTATKWAKYQRELSENKTTMGEKTFSNEELVEIFNKTKKG